MQTVGFNTAYLVSGMEGRPLATLAFYLARHIKQFVRSPVWSRGENIPRRNATVSSARFCASTALQFGFERGTDRISVMSVNTNQSTLRNNSEGRRP
jgi:hypothetical protein